MLAVRFQVGPNAHPLPPGNSRVRTSSTCRALAVAGRTPESVVVNFTPRAGRASSTMKAPLATATMTGRRMVSWTSNKGAIQKSNGIQRIFIRLDTNVIQRMTEQPLLPVVLQYMNILCWNG